MKRIYPCSLQFNDPQAEAKERVKRAPEDHWAKSGWVIESLEERILRGDSVYYWGRWGDPSARPADMAIPMTPTTLESCIDRYRVITELYESQTRQPDVWKREHDRIRNIFTEEVIPCAAL